jgi:hypothetical protein
VEVHYQKYFNSEDVDHCNLAYKLRCMPHNFHKDDFLEVRLCQSDTLLDLVLDELESWSATRYREGRGYRPFFTQYIMVNKTQ